MNLKDLNYQMSQLSHIVDCKVLAVHPAMTWLIGVGGFSRVNPADLFI